MIPRLHRRVAYRRHRLVVKLRFDELARDLFGVVERRLPRRLREFGDAALDLASRTWRDLEQEFPGLAIEKMFPTLGLQHNLERLSAGAAEDAIPVVSRLLSYFSLAVAPERIDEVLARVRARPEVELAYLEHAPVMPPEAQPIQLANRIFQLYLDAAPVGIDAEFARSFPGGKGQQGRFVDLEQGWDLGHQDLAPLHIAQPISGLNKDFFGHGTAVLGIVAAPETSPGVVGIAPQLASVGVVSEWRRPDRFSTAAAILSAAEAMQAGDVLLLEGQTILDDDGQTPIDQNGLLPVEIEPTVFDMVELVNHWGITVVEAAGNGGRLLDGVTDVGGERAFDRAVRDSGAILVGASLISEPPSGTHKPHPQSNFGNRIDCYGWGNGVFTAGDGEDGGGMTDHTNDFSGTSAAAAMVAGAAVLVQSLAQANGKAPFSPGELRRILSDPANGTASTNPATDRIGVMPDLRKIIQNELRLPAPGPVLVQ
jgi:subtilase family protein